MDRFGRYSGCASTLPSTMNAPSLPNFVGFTFAVVKAVLIGVLARAQIVVMVGRHVDGRRRLGLGWDFHRSCWPSNRRILQAATAPGKGLGWETDDSMDYCEA